SLGRKDDGEADLRRALTIARHQMARWWELRAGTDLARYFQDEGRYAEGVDTLQPILDWFADDLETASDLKDARALLEQLRSLSDGNTKAGRGDPGPTSEHIGHEKALQQKPS